MNRRTFLESGAASLALAGRLAAAQDTKVRRVGLIGSGWYGKCDLLRLVQVSPVEVVSLCDVDKTLLAEAAEIVASRQRSGKKPRTYADYAGTERIWQR
jgi:predicted homoserine dehydrogenase-like protein